MWCRFSVLIYEFKTIVLPSSNTEIKTNKSCSPFIYGAIRSGLLLLNSDLGLFVISRHGNASTNKHISYIIVWELVSEEVVSCSIDAWISTSSLETLRRCPVSIAATLIKGLRELQKRPQNA